MQWTTITPSNDPRYLVKGTELAQVLMGRNKRFALVQVRGLDADGQPGTFYRVRDANTVSDQQVREGMRPLTVHQCLLMDDAITWIEEQSRE